MTVEYMSASYYHEAMDRERSTRPKRRGPGRPPLPLAQRKGVRVTVRLTPAETALLARLAKRWGEQTGAALRRCIAVASRQEA